MKCDNEWQVTFLFIAGGCLFLGCLGGRLGDLATSLVGLERGKNVRHNGIVGSLLKGLVKLTLATDLMTPTATV